MRALEVDFESTDVPKSPQNEPPILRASIPLFSSERALRRRGERMHAMGERTKKQLFLEGCEAVTSSGILDPCATLNDALSTLHATRCEASARIIAEGQRSQQRRVSGIVRWTRIATPHGEYGTRPVEQDEIIVKYTLNSR